MCRTRIVHFSRHDVRPRMAINQRGTHRTFVDPIGLIICRCREFPRLPESDFDDPVHETNIPQPCYSLCPDHDCCVCWVQISLCAWLKQHLNEAVQDQGPAGFLHDCPNGFLTHSYYTIQRAMVPDPGTGMQLVSSIWRDNDLLEYPADIFYRHKFVGDEATAHENSQTRHSMFDLARQALDAKDRMLTGFLYAEECLWNAGKLTEHSPDARSSTRQAWLLSALGELDRGVGDLAGTISSLHTYLSIQASALIPEGRLNSEDMDRLKSILASQGVPVDTVNPDAAQEKARELDRQLRELRKKLKNELDGLRSMAFQGRKRKHRESI